MRVCIVYACLYPYTIGGGERWYRALAERVAAAGHDVTYVTLRQWERGEPPAVAGVKVIAVGPRLELYAAGRRRFWPPVRFALGVLRHLWRNRGRYDVVHCASTPFFPLLAAAFVQRRARFRLFVDWIEVWTLAYWREYAGSLAGTAGWAIQRLATRVGDHAFCFARLHGRRLLAEGFGRPVDFVCVYTGEVGRPDPEPAEPMVLFAGRLIPEKGVLAVPAALMRARDRAPELRATIFGDGPLRAELEQRVGELAANDAVAVRGFVAEDELRRAMRRALCLLLPSSREGYGLVVAEASSLGTPPIVVDGPDNAAVELVEDGVNGFVAPSAAPEDLAEAILRVRDAGPSLRKSTADWFALHGERFSLARSVQTVLAAYAR